MELAERSGLQIRVLFLASSPWKSDLATVHPVIFRAKHQQHMGIVTLGVYHRQYCAFTRGRVGSAYRFQIRTNVSGKLKEFIVAGQRTQQCTSQPIDGYIILHWSSASANARACSA
jgi:hypothetical protein